MDIFDQLKQASDDVRRLYALACFGQLTEFNHSVCESGVMAMRIWMANREVETTGIISKHRKAINDARRAFIENGPGKQYQRELYMETALHCLALEVAADRLNLTVWGLRGWMGEHFDKDIIECVGLGEIAMRPVKPIAGHVKKLAEDVLNGENVRSILADAISDEQLPEAWEKHLRKNCHWQGCHVLEQIVGV